MSDVMNRLTDYELSMIEYRRREFGNGETDDHAKDCDFASNSVFLSHWAKAKNSFLGNVFGDKLIIEKEIEVKIADEALYHRFENWKYKNDYVFDFYNQLTDTICNNRDNIIFANENRVQLDYYELRDFIHSAWLDNAKALANNTQYEDTCYFTYGEVTLKFQKGSKVMRNLGKLAKLFNINQLLFDEVKNYHSQLLNDNVIKGTLCLSIHPLDYMTMSDNASRWSSCMSWDEDGCYRQGTIEMLNSDSVVVAYIKADTPYYISKSENMVWNNKKFRTLLVATPQFVASVKSYPYSHSEVECMAINMLTDLISKSNPALDYDYTKPEEAHCRNDYTITFEGEKQFFFDFDTGYMYNDFQNTTKYFVAAERDFLSEYNDNASAVFYYNYSGYNQCIWCGAIDSITEDCKLCCEDCAHSVRCEYCGEDITDEEQFMLDGELFCEHCYTRLARKSIFDPEHTFNKNYEKVIGFYRDLGDGKAELFSDTFEVSDGEFLGFTFKEYLGKAIKVRKAEYPMRYSNFFVVDIDQVKKEFFSQYLHYVPTDLTKSTLVYHKDYDWCWETEYFEEVLED